MIPPSPIATGGGGYHKNNPLHCGGGLKTKSFSLPKRGLLTKCQYCTGLCNRWCLLLNQCPSGGKWLLYTVALVALTLGYDIHLLLGLLLCSFFFYSP